MLRKILLPVVYISGIAARYSGHAAIGGTWGSSRDRGWVSSGEHPFTITNGQDPGKILRLGLKNFMNFCPSRPFVRLEQVVFPGQGDANG